MKFIINSLQGCLKVVVYLLKGAAKFFLVKKGAVNQKRLRNTDLEHGYKVKWGLNDVFNLWGLLVNMGWVLPLITVVS